MKRITACPFVNSDVQCYGYCIKVRLLMTREWGIPEFSEPHLINLIGKFCTFLIFSPFPTLLLCTDLTTSWRLFYDLLFPVVGRDSVGSHNSSLGCSIIASDHRARNVVADFASTWRRRRRWTALPSIGLWAPVPLPLTSIGVCYRPTIGQPADSHRDSTSTTRTSRTDPDSTGLCNIVVGRSQRQRC